MVRRLLAVSALMAAQAAGMAIAQDSTVAQPTIEVESADVDLAALLQMKVTSASRQIESINEAPAPITVITSDMIRKSGARTLQDLLLLFVPGVTFVADQNEINVAMHGVYASAQQKILVMRDGHRLNSHAFSNLEV